MKGKAPLMFSVLLLAACNKESTPAPEDHSPGAGKRPHSASAGSGAPEETPEAPGKTKKSERPPQGEKKPPLAEAVPDQPGMVKSPFTGELVDVSGLPPGALARDPALPEGDKRVFRVPPGVGQPATPPSPVARQVPGKPGMVYSPYNNNIVDVTGMRPGSLVADPTFPAEEKKFFRVPGAPAPESTPDPSLPPGFEPQTTPRGQQGGETKPPAPRQRVVPQ